MNLQDSIHIACLLEASARKPGNVHPAASYPDLCYQDFVDSAAVAAPILAQTSELGVGRAVRDAVNQTSETVGRNTNLGIVLLLAPLAVVPSDSSLSDGIGSVLRGLSVCDAELVYQAIHVANPGGMGKVDDQDVGEPPTDTLLEVMQLAAHRDQIANQYATDFQLVLEFGVPCLGQTTDFRHNWETDIVDLHLRLMAEFPDTLIARKCGAIEAQESARQAQRLLDSNWQETSEPFAHLAEFDSWLRSKGNQRNPGTTADLVTACLFAAFREQIIEPPSVADVQRHVAQVSSAS